MRVVLIPIAIIAVLLAYGFIDPFKPDLVTGKKVFITGASTGIGEQIAYHYCRLGAEVFVTARREHRLKQVTEKCREIGIFHGKYHYMVADMMDFSSLGRLVQEAAKVMGGLDVVVLNHIMVHPMAEWTGSPENFDLLQNVLSVNFRSYVHLASHSLPHLEKSHGSIVVVSSIAGRLPQPYLASYSASKFALEGFFGSLRQELIMKESEVSLTICIIGLTGTDNAIKQIKEAGHDKLLATLPTAAPEDVAFAIVRGGTLRQNEVFFPYIQAKLSTIFAQFGDFTAAFNRYLLRKT